MSSGGSYVCGAQRFILTTQDVQFSLRFSFLIFNYNEDFEIERKNINIIVGFNKAISIL